ncbi:MAG: hypothetical protein RLZZ224_1806 [Verrucomicrobiota bacterium]|jgi:polyhydroxybutyrate depolymerase
MQNVILWFLPILLVLSHASFAATSIEIRIKVGDVERKALVFPAQDDATNGKKKSTPLVLCYHGHGGNALSASRSFSMHRAWPNACVVYPQGVPTPGRLTDPEGKQNGWQFEQGSHDDRDLHFFDMLLSTCTERFHINPCAIFVMGHSNGGAFTYLLWAHRSEKIQAVAPSAAVAHRLVPILKPKPCFHSMATNDRLVHSTWQEWMVRKIQLINLSQKQPTNQGNNATYYAPQDPSRGAPLIIHRHNQGHTYPTEVSKEIARFFQECLAQKHHR